MFTTKNKTIKLTLFLTLILYLLTIAPLVIHSPRNKSLLDGLIQFPAD